MKQPVIFTAALLASAAALGDSTPLANCAAVAQDSARLACYDAIAGRTKVAPPAAVAQPTEPAVGTAPGTGEGGFISPRLDQEQANVNNRFVIIPHHRNYLLPITFNSNINEEAWEQMHPGIGMDQAEAKFQISFKAIIWQDILGRDMDLWGAYTQQNWMQAYNTDASSPFRETDMSRS